jgi:hypothetical protein
VKVNVSFQFDSPEEAVQFLGRKVLGVQDAPKQPEAPKPTEKRGRGRPPKKAEAPQEPKSAAEPAKADPAVAASAPKGGTLQAWASKVPQPAAPVKSPAAEPSQAPQAPVAAVPSDADVTAALQAVLKATGMNKVTAIFARYGVQRGREVKGEDRTGFIAYCAKVASKEIDPEKGEANPE